MGAEDCAGSVAVDPAQGLIVLPHDRSEASIVAVDQQAKAPQDYCEQTGQAPPGYFEVGEAGAPVAGPKQ